MKSPNFVSQPVVKPRRVLLLADRLHAVADHVDPLLHNGYDVDCTYSVRNAVSLSRTRDYDLILIAVRRHPMVLQNLCRELRLANPGAPIASLVDPSKPIPPLHAHQFIWMREGEEYFMARVNALVEAC